MVRFEMHLLQLKKLMWLSTCILLLAGQSISNPQFPSQLLKYFAGPPEVHRIRFRPEDGLRNREIFEKKHGPHGEQLIQLLGQGLVPGVEAAYVKQLKEKPETQQTLGTTSSTTEIAEIKRIENTTLLR